MSTMILDIPDLPFLSMKTKRGTDSYSVRPHTHRELSVGIVLEGSTRVTVEGMDFELNGGDLIIVPADRPHLCIPSDPLCFDFHMVYFDPWWLRALIDIDARTVSPRAFPAPERWSILFEDLANGRCGKPIESDLIDALRALLAGCGASVRGEAAATLLEGVHRMMKENPARTMSVEDLASAAGMSKYDFLRKYTHRYGLTPHSSLTDARIRKSLFLMRAGGSLTDIAQDCGFSDQSHFIRQFKRYTGIRPSEYQKAISSNRSTAVSS